MSSCGALTVKGARCRRAAVAGGDRCAVHGGRRVSEGELVGTVLAAARGGEWRAAAWVLERRFPARWRRGHVVEEREPQPVVAADGLDQLAARRAERRTVAS